MKVIVYVEGRSDVLAMRALLRGLIEAKKKEGILIDFFEIDEGDRKKNLLIKGPKKAVNILRSNPADIVAIIPDLYPPGITFPHRTHDELRDGIMRVFVEAVREKGEDVERFSRRFHVFCFKHDLEVLLLAADEQLRRRLGAHRLQRTWAEDVEDQNHDIPPKRIIEHLYREHERAYGVAEASIILEDADYKEIAERCSQCFKPFIEFLTSLQPVA